MSETNETHKPLTAKQQAFVEEYLVDLNGTQAAIRAGYAESGARTEAVRQLTNANVAAAIAEAKKARLARTQVTQEMVLDELRKIGFQDIRKAVRWGSNLSYSEDGGEPVIISAVDLVNSDEIDDDTAAAISEVSQTKEGIKIKMHDKKGALVDLGKHLGLFEKEDKGSGEIHIHFDGLLKGVL